MKSLELTIRDIFDRLVELRRVSGLRAERGLSARVIISMFNESGLDCPDDIVEVYGICNGTRSTSSDSVDEIAFFPGFYWMRLEECFEVYNSIRSSDEWSRLWFPIFANGGGDFYAVVCDKKSSDFGALVGFILGEKDHLIEFRSLKDMISVISECLGQKVFFVSDGIYQADYASMRLISAKIQAPFFEHEVIIH